MRRVLLIALLLATNAVAASAQSAEGWLERGHAAAQADRHLEAIAAYERALQLAPALRPELLARLGRQYLWADRPMRAATLLKEYLEAREECDVRADYALALAWADRLPDAAANLERVIRGCGTERPAALLRLGLVRRWQDRPTAAETAYRAALDGASGSGEQAADARLGLAHVALQRGLNRRALAAFLELARTAPAPRLRAVAAEGATLALTRLGESQHAVAAVEALAGTGTLSRDMAELRSRLAAADRPRAGVRTRGFRDVDGTASEVVSLFVETGWGGRGRAGIGGTRTGLEHADSSLTTSSLDGDVEYRWSPALAARAGLHWSHLEERDWRPLSGELGVVLTPTDLLRFDLGAARLLVMDNVAAVQNELAGTLLTAGADLRAGYHLTIVPAADVTAWSTGNRRIRLRASARWQLEGVPRLTLELPFMLQRYDQPMPFAFFSPREYVEAGPALNVYRRIGRSWNVSAYGRAGWQREDEGAWDPFGTLRGSVWRDAARGWSVRGNVAWSNSNLASPGAFRRTSVDLELARSF